LYRTKDLTPFLSLKNNFLIFFRISFKIVVDEGYTYRSECIDLYFIKQEEA